VKQTLRDFLCPQPKSKIKAGNGQLKGAYNFYTSSQIQSKFFHSATYTQPALIFGTGGMASVHYCNEPFSTSTDCLVMYGRQGAPLELIYYYLRSNMHLLQDGFKGAGLQHISKDYILNINIDMPAPSLQEQITHQMRLIDAMINGKKQQILSFDEAVKSRFIELFGDPVDNDRAWPTETLNSVCSTIVDCPHSTPSYTSDNTGYMCIRTSIVKKNHIMWDEIEYIPEQEYYQRIQRKRPERGDIIYTREGAILGIAAMIDRECNVALGQRSMLLSPNTYKCLPQFLSAAMNFDSFLRKALGGVSGSASPHINVGDIKAFAIILPPIELQEQFAAFVEQTDKSKLAVQKGLQELEILKKSLMQQYFG
jgi:type I restriction enzyme S subunit